MKALELATYIRYKLKMNTMTLPDTDLLPIVNMWMESMAQRIVGVNEDLLGMVVTTDLIANQRQYQDPVDLIKMKYLEAQFDGVNWSKLTEFDIIDSQKTTDETSILANFANQTGSCFFDRFGSGFIIYSGPIIDVTDGLKMHAILSPKPLANLTENTVDMSTPPDSTSCGFPREFHELLARRVIIDIKDSGDVPKGLTQKEQLFIVNFDDKVDDLAGINLDRTVKANVPDDGSDNGFNY